MVKTLLARLPGLAGLLPAMLAAVAGQAAEPYWYLRGEASSVKNDDGALVVSYGSGRTAEGFVHLAGRTPIIWARYNPGQAIGHILVTRAFRMPDGATQVRVTPFRPGDGSRFSTGGAGKRLIYFGGVNPFAQFNPGGDDYFRGVNFTAFLASTGLVMRSMNASVAFVYYPALTPLQSVRGSGSELAWSATGTATFNMEGRWLLGLQGEAGDRRGFVPAFRVQGCNPLVDTRNGCVVKGFASFVPWDYGSLPSSTVTVASRAGSERPELGAMGAAFAGLEGYLRDASLWSDASWTSIAGVTASNGLYTLQAGKIGEGDLGRRDRLAEINSAAPGQLNGTATYGTVTPGSPTFWNPSDAATAEFVTRPLAQVGGGLGSASSTSDWRSARDGAIAQDVRSRQGTSAAIRVINETTH